MSTLDPRALKAARTAYQSAIPEGAWYTDGGETDAPIRAAITAYLAISQPQAGEPVAMQWRKLDRVMKHEDVWSYVDYHTGLQIAEHPEKYETRPLYASPQPALAVKGVTDAMESAALEAAALVAPPPSAEVEALREAADRFDEIRVILIEHLDEPERNAFWKAVNGREFCRHALATEGRKNG